MATKIVTKNSSTASAVPTASDLVQGELAVNVADKRLFTEDNAGAIVELGTNPSTLTVTGEITANGGIALGDNDKATFGANDALEIYSDGSKSIIKESGAESLVFQATNVNFKDATDTDFTARFITGGDVRLYHDGDQKIATTSTGIDVTGTATMDAVDLSGGADGTIGDITLAQGNGTSKVAKIYGTSANTNEKGIRLNTYHYADIDAVTITSDGNVGIGTSSPSEKLHVVGGNIKTDSVVRQIGYWEADAVHDGYFVPYNASGQSELVNSFTTGALLFKTGTSKAERMRIDSSGNVGIGTTSINSTLSVGSTDAGATITSGGTNTHLQLKAMGSAGVLIFGAGGVSNGTAGTERMRIDSSGNLLVGTTSSAGKLTVRQDSTTASPLFIVNAAISGKFATFEGNGSVHGSITWSGSTTSYNTSSDQRLKENIADADDAGSKIDAIQVRKYDWKVDGSHQDYGMIAQELQLVAPEAVSVPEDSEEMMGVDYSKLVPMLIKEIQSLRNRVAQLEG